MSNPATEQQEFTTIKFYDIMKQNLTPEQICEYCQKMVDAKLIRAYTLLPQNLAKYRWVRSNIGPNLSIIIPHTCEDVLAIVPELKPYLQATSSGKFCHLELTL